MDKLPAELIFNICTLLNVKDLGHLRRVSKFFGNVGRPFMYRRLHIIFTPDSFKRLQEICSDPTLAPYVTSLYYEADTLARYESFGNWEQEVVDPRFYQKSVYTFPPGPGSSPRALRAYRRELRKLNKMPRHHYSASQLATAYDKYRQYSEEQDALRVGNYQAKTIADALVNLPNLDEIFLALEREPTKQRKIAYSDSFVTPYGDNSGTQPLGVPQLLSLLLGRGTKSHIKGMDDARAASTPVGSVGWPQKSPQIRKKLRSLCCATVNWRFFQQTDEVFQDLRAAVGDLVELGLDISVGSDDSHKATDEEKAECAEYLDSGRVLEFLAAAPNLQLLWLRFAWSKSHRSAQLRFVLGQHKWDYLANVSLSWFSSREQDLVGFCATHAATLRKLIINQFLLVRGSWLSTFQQMRLLLQLKEVRLCGSLEASEFDEFWMFTVMSLPGETTMSRLVRDYILEGGDGPLLDLRGYDQLTFQELKEMWRAQQEARE